MKFTKMHGCGNDYVYINGFDVKMDPADKPEFVKFVSDRHMGIGGDGAIFINPSDKADFEMEMYNADGTRAEMCGNGIRCVAKYVYDNHLTDSTQISVISAGSIKYLTLSVKDGLVETVRVDMGEPILEPELVPVSIPGFSGDRVLNVPIEVQGSEYGITCVSMGNPHAVTFVDDVSAVDIDTIGPHFENHAVFPKRVNTEFVHVVDRNHIDMRVWERGTGETLACGTGACASAVACILGGMTDNSVEVSLLGGKLHIDWEGAGAHVFMTGPAVSVFEGEIAYAAPNGHIY